MNHINYLKIDNLSVDDKVQLQTDTGYLVFGVMMVTNKHILLRNVNINHKMELSAGEFEKMNFEIWDGLSGNEITVASIKNFEDA